MNLPFFKQIFYAIAVLMTSNNSLAHTGSIRGKITDAKTGTVLEGVNIYLPTADKSTVTDAFGLFLVRGLAPGAFSIFIDAPGYSAISDSFQIEDGMTTELAFSMNKSQVQLADVTINADKATNHSSISLIDVKLRPVNTAQDMMRLVPGIFISQHQGGGKAEQIFLRGFDVDHGTDINVSVDGMPVNMVSHAHGQGYSDLHFLIPELIDKMEFGKGPYAIDRGNLATAGWVAFKTKDHLDNSFVKLEGGSYGYFRAVTAVDLLGKTAAARNESAYIAGEYGYNRSYFDAPQDLNRFNLTGKYTKQIGDNKMFALTASGFHSTWSASGQVPQRAVTNGIIGRFGELDREGGGTSRYHVNMQYAQSTNQNTTFKTNLYAGYYDFALYSNFTFFAIDTVNGDQIFQKEARIFAGYNASIFQKHRLFGLDAKAELGMGVRYDNVDNSELSHTVNRQFLSNIRLGDIRETNLFAYVNETVHLLPQLVATIGARYDYFIQGYENKIPTAVELSNAAYKNAAISPKIGMYYNFGKAGRLYVNYGVGFHSNDTRDIYFRPESGKDVLPLAHSADIGIVIKPLPSLLIQAAVFNMALQQEYTYPGDAGDAPTLSGRTRRIGVDFSGRYEAAKWIYFDVDLNFTKARYVDEPSGSDYVELAPSFTTAGGITLKPLKHLSAGLRYRVMGDRPANADNSILVPRYTVVDFTAGYSRARYELGMQIQNLTNVEWNEAAFATETRLRGESRPVDELCFTPGVPFFLKLCATYKF